MENIEKIVLKKQNGEVEIKYMTPALEERIKNDEGHLCGDKCSLKVFMACPKVKDKEKKAINQYDFVTDGIQVLDENGEVERFIVHKCNNFEYSPMQTKRPKVGAEQSAHIRYLKECMKTTYFDANSLMEAHIKQYMEEQRGRLKNIGGKRPSEENILNAIAQTNEAEMLLTELSDLKKAAIAKKQEDGYKTTDEEKSLKLVDDRLQKVIKEREAKEAKEQAEIAELMKPIMVHHIDKALIKTIK